MKNIRIKYIGLVLISGFWIAGFLSSCEVNPDDTSPIILEDFPFEGEDEDEEICLPFDTTCVQGPGINN